MPSQKINCPLFRRIIARLLDIFVCVSIILLVSLLLINYKLGNDIRHVYLTRKEMVIIALTSISVFFLFFILVPMFLKGRTITKYFFGIHCSFNNVQVYHHKLVIREFFLILLPLITSAFIPLAFSEKEFQELFNHSFINNWNASLKSIPFRVVFFLTTGIYLLSMITVFVSKKRKTIYDFMADTWIYIYKKKDEQNYNKKNTQKKTIKKARTGEFVFTGEGNNILKNENISSK